MKQLFVVLLCWSPGLLLAAENTDIDTLRQIVTVQQAEIQALKELYQENFGPRGALRVAGKEVVNATGEWVGEPAGLVGPKGEQGPKGDPGLVGPKGDPGNPAIGHGLEPAHCIWSEFVNDWDHPANFTCPHEHLLVGMASEHNNSKEDRRFRFHCCTFRVKP